jgi:hypothetical protein
VVEEAGERRLFCSEQCERLYRDYWLPTYGDSREPRSSR